ncbi:MAG: prepilin-type N-terminal cleavage/methylation domain-containing protein [Deltaproteobacteria bacterium]|nr:prepilin-type N-terminal cleavage/methylation domain-containing protein [Deltaproteobacteria bacterium]
MKSENGFTLYELMIAAAISSFVLLAIHSIYKIQQKSYVVQSQVSAMQQNLRGGLCFMQREIRMSGYDPQDRGHFGIIDVGLDAGGNGTITFSLDDNLNNEADESDGNGNVDDRETFVYALDDFPISSPDGVLDLGRKRGVRRELVVNNIEAMGFAYGFDSTGDGDNSLDRDTNGHVIWAIDSDNDKDLDVNLDTDNDGDIDTNDDPGGVTLAHDDNGGLDDVPLSDIRAVRIWLLARGDRADSNTVNSMTYVVSNQRMTPKDGLPRRLLTSKIDCRNMGVWPNN